MSTVFFSTVLMHSRGVRVVGGMCLLMAAWLISPQSAEASCGDYLAHPQHPLAADRMTVGQHTDTELPVPARPCNGPSCRRSNAPLPLPAPAPVPVIGERWAHVLNFEVVLPLAATELSRTTDEFSTSAFPQRLDRPPIAV